MKEKESYPEILGMVFGEEEVLWWGRPDKVGMALGKNPLLLVLFALAPVAVASLLVDWYVAERELVYIAFAIVLFLWGEYVVVSGVMRRYRAAADTIYAASRTRVLIMSPLLMRGGVLLDINNVLPFAMQHGWRGLKHIVFSSSDRNLIRIFSNFCDILPISSCLPGFYFLSDVSELVEKLNAAINEHEEEEFLE